MIHENLKGRVAVVTGGGGVLCGQFAKTLAKQGCKVAVLDLNEAAAQKCADEIISDGGEAIAVGCNVLDTESMQKARQVINEKFGTLTEQAVIILRELPQRILSKKSTFSKKTRMLRPFSTLTLTEFLLYLILTSWALLFLPRCLQRIWRKRSMPASL